VVINITRVTSDSGYIYLGYKGFICNKIWKI
jgi:hypothetical protein